MSNIINPIKTIYNEREKFIILGLTGRTGSGCTTVSKLLETDLYKELNMPNPQTNKFSSTEERKYQIIYNYAEQHWSGFYRISMTDIILSFVILTAKELQKLLNSIFYQDTALSKKIFDDCKHIDNFFKLYKDIKKIYTKCYNKEEQKLKRNINFYRMEVDLLKKINKFQDQIKEIFKKYTYTYNEIDNSTGEVKKDKKTNEALTYTANSYTYFLQTIGTNIRKSGKPDDSSFSGQNMFNIARRANDFIKAIKYTNEHSEKPGPTFICLDAIRNPYEAIYFQDRYSSFYLLSVNTDDEERIRRLTNLGYSKPQIDCLDNIEYGRLKGEKKFTNPDIGTCCQRGYIYI